MHGVLPLDKPPGATSNEVLQQVKRLFNARKAGHTGSLDKLASGLLPLCFGEATKFSGYLLDADKRYSATCRLGIQTTTGDVAGEIVRECPVPELDATALNRILDAFRGDIEQVPPMFSALKHKGQRLYELAYQGIEVERKPRPVHIYELELLRYEGSEFDIRVTCSKGTYIRTLAEDIGARVGCGAHVQSLRRTGVGQLREEEMIPLPRVLEASAKGMAALDGLLIGVDTILRDVPQVVLQDNVAYYLLQGQPVIVPRAPTAGRVRIYHESGAFLGAGEVLDDGRIAPRRLYAPGNGLAPG